jgi:ABC-type nickel/cobalt efflux system permease component RcnA
MHQLLLKMASVLVLVLAWSGIAKADVAAASTESTLLLVGAGLVVVVVLWLLIRGALSLSGKEDKDEDGGFGVLEGIDDEDEDRKKKP